MYWNSKELDGTDQYLVGSIWQSRPDRENFNKFWKCNEAVWYFAGLPYPAYPAYPVYCGLSHARNREIWSLKFQESEITNLDKLCTRKLYIPAATFRIQRSGPWSLRVRNDKFRYALYKENVCPEGHAGSRKTWPSNPQSQKSPIRIEFVKGKRMSWEPRSE